MSRFSKSEAEAQGWVFVHEQEPEEIVTNSVQGETRVREGYARAEKTYNGIALNEVAPNMGLLLEKIALTEAHWAAVEESQETVEPEIAAEEVDEPIRTVTLPGGEVITEEEYSSRDKRDVLVVSTGDDGEHEQIVVGPSEEAAESDVEREEISAEAENERTAEERFRGTKQIEVQAPQIDNPGGHGGGLVVVRKGEDLDSAAERREQESADAESEKDISARRLPGEEEPFVEVEAPSAEELEQARSEAEAEAVKKLDDDASEAEREAAAAEAGAKAEQDLKDKAEEEAEEEEPEATPAAEEAAKEKGIDLSQVEGSGKEGKITKPDVDAAADAESEGLPPEEED